MIVRENISAFIINMLIKGAAWMIILVISLAFLVTKPSRFREAVLKR
jgi:hypothetical protein